MLTSSANRLRLAPVALISLAAAWGLAFVIMKDSIERQSVNSFLFTRFGIATLVLLALRPMIFRLITKELFTKGFLAGLLLGAGFILQTEGLARTDAGITGFITGLYVVATPLISALFLKKKITLFTWGMRGSGNCWSGTSIPTWMGYGLRGISGAPLRHCLCISYCGSWPMERWKRCLCDDNRSTFCGNGADRKLRIC